MTKQEELDILKDAIAKLGRNSYLGDWLAEQVPFVESAILSDVEPTITIKECELRCKNEIVAAGYHAAKIIEKARNEAELIVLTAKNQDEKIRQRLRKDIKAIEALI